MKISCNRCGTELESPDKRNAYYINETIVKDEKPISRKLIICKDCKKENDELIW